MSAAVAPPVAPPRRAPRLALVWQVKLLMRAERSERRAAAVEEEMTEMVRDRVRGRGRGREG